MADTKWFECNPGDLARILNTYSSIVAKERYLNDPYTRGEDKKEVAQWALTLLSDFYVRVPKETIELLSPDPKKIKERCLEILSKE